MSSVTKENMEEFVWLASSMSPEIVHQDGEATPAEARRRMAKLNGKWKTLEKKIGRKMSEEEVWDYAMA